MKDLSFRSKKIAALENRPLLKAGDYLQCPIEATPAPFLRLKFVFVFQTQVQILFTQYTLIFKLLVADQDC